MICKDCAREADGRLPGFGWCPVCGKAVTLTPKSRTFVNHKHNRVQCSGFKRAPTEGHAACRGGTHCDCKHGKG